MLVRVWFSFAGHPQKSTVIGMDHAKKALAQLMLGNRFMPVQTHSRGLHGLRGGGVSDKQMQDSEPDLRYVSQPASDAADQVGAPAKYPRDLYPEIEPYEKGMLDVGDGHKLYYDVSGNPDGVPAIFLHGGPGAGCSPRCRRFFDPAFYKIVILDQRGSGQSIPNAADDLSGSLVENNTPKLVSDIEKLREHLGVPKWGLVLGGSWGSTLALAYAQAHPDRCEAILLRGVFLFGPDEVGYLFSDGVGRGWTGMGEGEAEVKVN